MQITYSSLGNTIERERERATVCVVSEAAAMQISETKAEKDAAATEFIR